MSPAEVRRNTSAVRGRTSSRPDEFRSPPADPLQFSLPKRTGDRKHDLKQLSGRRVVGSAARLQRMLVEIFDLESADASLMGTNTNASMRKPCHVKTLFRT
jgi:hypothetical protein